jgi:5,5'-dehydrodivanillate O-demethylase oxygenase subunit
VGFMSAIDHRRQRQDRLTRIGPGTPMGDYMRCFWHPVAAVAELAPWPVRKVRLLGEDLALFGSEDGSYGLVSERCPHRGASLACGMTDGGGIRCAYHGWKYDAAGNCVDTPAEPSESKLKQRIRIDGYPVQEMGGLLWAYMGKMPAPLLPRYEYLVREDYDKDVGISRVACNWLQIAENTLDPLHIEYLHMLYTNWALRQKGQPEISTRKHARTAFDLFEYGIIKRRMWIGDTEETEEWTIGHPQLFPATAVVPYNSEWVQFQIRVPVDDENTTIYWYNSRLRAPGVARQASVPIWDNPYLSASGEYIPEQLNAQDMMVMVTQGSITDHTREHLAESDRGVALYRKTLLEQVDAVVRGEDPLGVIRDPAKNTPWIEIPVEKHLGYSLSGVVASAAYDFPDEPTREVVRA